MNCRNTCSGKDEILNRLRRVEGQIRGIARMVEEGKGCIDILNQVTAARAALNKTGSLIIKKYCKECIGSVSTQEGDSAIKELMDIIEKTYDY